MSAVRSPARADGLERNGHTGPNRVRRLSSEATASFKTKEFFAFLIVLAGILISAGVVDEANNGLGARQAWLYATILTVGYMVSRGLAEAGSRQPYHEDRSNRWSLRRRRQRAWRRTRPLLSALSPGAVMSISDSARRSPGRRRRRGRRHRRARERAHRPLLVTAAPIQIGFT
jgi:hypothetical protein